MYSLEGMLGIGLVVGLALVTLWGIYVVIDLLIQWRHNRR